MRRLVSRLRTRTAAFLHDLLMIPVAWVGAYALRFNLEVPPPEYMESALSLLPVIVLINGTVFWYVGLYRGVWRFASMPDLVRIMKAVLIGVLLAGGALFLMTRMQFVPRSILPLQAILLALLLSGPRLAYRWVKDRRIELGGSRAVLIVGAGEAGEGLVRDLLREPALGYRPVGFVDDDPAKKGMEIRGLRVLAKTAKLPLVVAEQNVELVLLARPSAGAAEMRRLVELCKRADVPFRTVPPLEDLLHGRARLADLRQVSIEDLLGRESVSLDWTSIRKGVDAATIVVTGGAGSIGSELCRQIARLNPGRLVIVDQSEFGLYEINKELRATFTQLEVEIRLCDVCDSRAIDWLMTRVRPSMIFHAAAYKHVPMLESQPREALRNNVTGTRNVADSAARHGVETMVLISTDKAVNPTNVMGVSKRIAELYCQNADEQYRGTRFITVRFGNVLGSAGSVVPLFQEQIEQGGPITVTHADMERYFMTIPEACQLILEAGTVGQGGEIFVLDMGEPVSIRYLAEQMVALAGKRVGEDIDIQYTGLRAGEKLSEELFHEHEKLESTDHPKLLLARTRKVGWNWLNRRLDTLLEACEQFDEGGTARVIGELVPEYRPEPVESNNVVQLERLRR
ncbi:MAG: nucleoside-diphosphate sugar epimerase/dehydratase [Pseudomonadota bacterium]